MVYKYLFIMFLNNFSTCFNFVYTIFINKKNKDCKLSIYCSCSSSIHCLNNLASKLLKVIHLYSMLTLLKKRNFKKAQIFKLKLNNSLSCCHDSSDSISLSFKVILKILFGLKIFFNPFKLVQAISNIDSKLFF